MLLYILMVFSYFWLLDWAFGAALFAIHEQRLSGRPGANTSTGENP